VIANEFDRKLLSNVPLFAGFSDSDLVRIGPYLEPTSYEAGQVILWEGRPHRSLFVLAAGAAVVTKVVRGEVESVLARLTAGAHFGELSLIDARPAAASVAAESDCRVLVISSDGLQALMVQHPALHARLSWALLRDLAAKLRATNRKVQDAVEWGLGAAGGPDA